MRELTDLELDILKILADNKGHALWELVKLLGKEKSNLIIILNRLEEEIELTDISKIGYYDVIKINSLGLSIYKSDDLLSKYICARFKADTIRCLNFNPPDFSFYGYSELDRLLDDPLLYNEKRFAHVAISEKTLKMINRKPSGQNLRCLNRKLLEEAYPKFILKGCDSIICKGASRKTTNPKSRQPRHHEIPYFININLLVLKYILINLKLINSRFFKRLLERQRENLDNLKERREWQLIDDDEYSKLKNDIESELYASDEHWNESKKMLSRRDDLIGSQYALEFVKCFGFRNIIHLIHGMVGGWDDCWRLGESAINSGIIDNEVDLECAEKLIRFHQSVEVGFKQLEQDGKGFEDNDV